MAETSVYSAKAELAMTFQQIVHHLRSITFGMLQDLGPCNIDIVPEIVDFELVRRIFAKEMLLRRCDFLLRPSLVSVLLDRCRLCFHLVGSLHLCLTD